MSGRRNFVLLYIVLPLLFTLFTPGFFQAASCFLKWTNCIVVNAQPFYRRSLITPEQCMTECRNMQSGTYACRSIVFDNVNKICDLFAHVGNAYPSKLMRYYGRDYYEISANCRNGTVTPGPTSGLCPTGRQPRYLRMDGFELQGQGDATIPNLSREQCIQACQNQRTPDGQQVTCKSFDYIQASQTCMISSNVASPTGTGTLVETPGSAYYEVYCVPDGSTCGQELERVPQKVLIGFAENVITTPTYQECIDACITGTAGLTCRSVMYYYSETDQNCILNSETKDTPNGAGLFTDDNENQVDYFQLDGCNNRRRSPTTTKVNSLRILRRPGRVRLPKTFSGENNVEERFTVPFDLNDAPTSRLGQWTQWSTCDRPTGGRRVRYKICGKSSIKQCPTESQWCTSGQGEPLSTVFVKAKSASGEHLVPQIDCPVGKCCPHKGSCLIGIMQLADATSRWCTRPC